MAKTSLIQRELKREQLVAKYKKKYDELKGIATVVFSTICALRIRVSISAMGSLMLM